MRFTGEEKEEERQEAVKHVKGLWGRVKKDRSVQSEAERISE